MAGSLINQAVGNSSGTNATTVTITAPAYGNTLVVYATSVGATAFRSISSFTYTGVSTWKQVGIEQGSSTSYNNTEIWVGIVDGASPGTSLTINWNTGGQVTFPSVACNIAEFSLVSNTLDANAAGLNTNAGTSASTGSFTNAHGPALLLTCVGYNSGTAPSASPGGSFTSLTYASNSTTAGLAASYGFVTGSAARSGNWTIPSVRWCTVLGSIWGSTATTQTQSGVSRIQITTTKTQSGVSRIQITTPQTQSGVSRIQITTPKTQSGISRIQITTPQTQSGVSRIQITTTQTQSGVSRIQITTPQTQSGVSNIRNTSTQTQSGVSRIQITTTQTQSGVSRIQITTPQTQSGVSRIQITTTQTQSGVSRIQITTPQTQSGVSNIRNTSTQTQSGVSRIQITTPQTQDGVSRIQITTPQTQSGVSNIRNTSIQTQSGISRIQITTPKTQSGVSRIQITTPQTQSGVSNIRNTSTVPGFVSNQSQWITPPNAIDWSAPHVYIGAEISNQFSGPQVPGVVSNQSQWITPNAIDWSASHVYIGSTIETQITIPLFVSDSFNCDLKFSSTFVPTIATTFQIGLHFNVSFVSQNNDNIRISQVPVESLLEGSASAYIRVSQVPTEVLHEQPEQFSCNFSWSSSFRPAIGATFTSNETFTATFQPPNTDNVLVSQVPVESLLEGSTSSNIRVTQVPTEVLCETSESFMCNFIFTCNLSGASSTLYGNIECDVRFNCTFTAINNDNIRVSQVPVESLLEGATSSHIRVTQVPTEVLTELIVIQLQSDLTDEFTRIPLFVYEEIDFPTISTSIGFTADGISSIGGFGIVGEDKEEYVTIGVITHALSTQETLEILATGNPHALLTQITYEMLVIPNSNALLTQCTEEVITLCHLAIINDVAIEAIAYGNGGDAIIDAVSLECIFSVHANALLSQAVKEILATGNPDVLLSQTTEEILVYNQLTSFSNLIIDQIAIEQLFVSPGNTEIQSCVIEIINNNAPNMDINAVALEVLGNDSRNGVIDSVAVEVMGITPSNIDIDSVAIEMLVRSEFDPEAASLVNNPRFFF